MNQGWMNVIIMGMDGLKKVNEFMESKQVVVRDASI
jgi:hypothetical protein